MGWNTQATRLAPHIPDPIEPVPQDQILPAHLPRRPPAFDFRKVGSTNSCLPCAAGKPYAAQRPPRQVARPVDKQPAAFEALGLVPLPTDQPKSTAGTLKIARCIRPVIRGSKHKRAGPFSVATHGKPSRRDRNRQKRNAAACDDDSKHAEPRESFRGGSHKTGRSPILCSTDPAALDNVAAGHSEPIAAQTKALRNTRSGTQNPYSNSASPSVADPSHELAVHQAYRRRPGNRRNTHGANRTNCRGAHAPCQR